MDWGGQRRLRPDQDASSAGDAAGGRGHFAKPGANDRIWNSLEKNGLADPANFAAYCNAPALALASRAWLGPAYQMTAPVSRVNPLAQVLEELEHKNATWPGP